jgi:hypothetical protein
LWRTRETIKKLDRHSTVYALPGLDIPETKAKVETIDFRPDFKPDKKYLAAATCAWFLVKKGLFPIEAFLRSVELSLPPELANKSVESIKKAIS